MKFLCHTSCIDSGNLSRLNSKGIPETHNYKREVVYDIDEKQMLHLTAVGLFPEFFAYTDDISRMWVEQNNDRLCDIVDARVLPYRKLTAEEAQNDADIAAGRKNGKYTLPHGPIAPDRVKLIRKGKSLAELAADPRQTSQPGDPVQNVVLKRKAKYVKVAPAADKRRRPLTEEQRQVLRDRLAKGREAKAKQRAEEKAVPAGV